MKAKCITAVRAAAKELGRERITDAEIAQIEGRLRRTMRQLARTEEHWQTLSYDQRVSLAAQRAMADIRAEAQRKVTNAQLQIVKTAATEERIATKLRLFDGEQRAHALVREMDDAVKDTSGIRGEYMGRLMDLLNAVKSGDGAGLGRRLAMFLFDAENPKMTRDIATEIYGNADGSSGNKVAQQGAKAWLTVIEEMRKRFNHAGGDVGRLDYGYVPQPHDSARVRGAGRDAWVQDVMPLVDRARYVDEAGARLPDAEVQRILGEMWETIRTDGLSKKQPGAFQGTGARANRGSEGRELHFKDGDAYLAYMQRYGSGTMFDAMAAHVGGLARDIALVERYGPNPNAQMRLQFDLAARADGTQPDQLERSFVMRPQSYWDQISGVSTTPQSARIAQVGTDVRNIQTFGKLGAAVISSLTDIGTFVQTTGYNKLPYWDAFKNVGRLAASRELRDTLSTHGILAESMMGDLTRYTGETLRHNWSGMLAQSTMKLSLMNAWTDTLRRAFSLTMMQGMARMSKTEWGKLTEWDRTHLERAGITEADWKVITSAELSEFSGMQHLTPEAIRAVDIEKVRPEDMQRVRDEITTQTAELAQRNAQEQQWISGRIDKFDDARDTLNRAVKALRDKKLAKNETATEGLLQRMALLDAQRDQAKLQADIETHFNRLVTQDEVRSFLNAVEDGASADLTAEGPAKKAVRTGVDTAESVGRRYGEQKGRLQRRMQELESKIAEMDRDTSREVNAAAKEAQAKAEAMGKDLAEFIARSERRQTRRARVIERLLAQEQPRIEAEADRIKNEVVAKVLGLITNESEYAVINPDLATKALTSGGGMQRGTVHGELARSVMQFKSFPIAMISRHWRRVLDTPQVSDGSAPMAANRLVYGGALLATTTALGAIALQAKQIIAGKDPIDMEGPHAGKFWARAVAQGGGLSIVGDLLLNDPGESSSGTARAMMGSAAGPAISTVAQVAAIGIENIWKATKGKETHTAAESISMLRQNAPFVNLWYARAALDHAGMHALQENLSPGYLSKMQKRASKEWGQEYWWAPGTGAPGRAPDIGKAVGQ
jgi:hypothetical protein